MQRMMCRPGRFPLVGQEDGGMLTPDHVGHYHEGYGGYGGSQLLEAHNYNDDVLCLARVQLRWGPSLVPEAL